jgi:hypothetical protein
MPVHECSSIIDLWPCHTLTGVGSRWWATKMRCLFRLLFPEELQDATGLRSCYLVIDLFRKL